MIAVETAQLIAAVLMTVVIACVLAGLVLLVRGLTAPGESTGPETLRLPTITAVRCGLTPDALVQVYRRESEKYGEVWAIYYRGEYRGDLFPFEAQKLGLDAPRCSRKGGNDRG